MERKNDVKEFRVSLGLTQEEFARIVGVSVGTISSWERGKTSPSPMARKCLEEIQTGMKNQKSKKGIKEGRKQ